MTYRELLSYLTELAAMAPGRMDENVVIVISADERVIATEIGTDSIDDQTVLWV